MKTFFVPCPAALTCELAEVVRAEVNEVRAAQQFGLSYLALMPMEVIEDQKLVEKHAKECGLSYLKAKWVRVAGSAAMNAAQTKEPVEQIRKVIENPKIEYPRTAQKSARFAECMSRVGANPGGAGPLERFHFRRGSQPAGRWTAIPALNDCNFYGQSLRPPPSTLEKPQK